MNGKLKYLLLMLITAVCLDATSQNSQVLYYMKLPQNHLLNPAIRPSDKFYIGIPVITGINTGFGNDFLKISDIAPAGTIIDSSFIKTLNPETLANKLKDKNSIATDASIQLLGLGMSFGKDLYVFFDMVDRFNTMGVFPRDLMKLYLIKPADLADQSIDLSVLNFKVQYYREYGLGFSKNVTQKLRIGAKVKLLSGIASASMDNRSLSLKVNNDFTQTVTADASLNISGKETLNKIFSDNGLFGKSDSTTKTDIKGFAIDYFRQPISNFGLGLDVGAVFNLNKYLSFSASVTDLGYIKWKHDLKNFRAHGSFDLPGLSLTDIINDPDPKLEDIYDPIVNAIKDNFIDTLPGSFKTYLPMGVSAGISFNPFTFLSIGVLSNTKFYAKTVNEAVTLSANAYVGRIVTASLSYTMANYTYNNLGFGLGFKTGSIFQFYVIADKIPLDWGKIYIAKDNGEKSSPIPIPQSMNLFNLSIGMNIVFGKPVTKKTDRPMIVVQ